jgi:DNA-directed RNA polymerase subunit RPC12/RpoP
MNGRLCALFIRCLPTEQTDIVSKCSKLFNLPEEMQMAMCIECGDEYDDQRSMLGYRVCMECGDAHAHQRKFTIAPLNKSNYMLFTDISLLKQLNPKRTT